MPLQKKPNSFVVPVMLARYVWCMKAIITSIGSRIERTDDTVI